MAELNLVFTVLCQHCGRPLYGRVKFCPSCGKEESISLVAGAASARRALERDPADQASQPGIQAPVAVAPAAVPRHEVQEAVSTPAGSGAARKLTEEAHSAPARVAARIESPSKEPAPPVAVLLTPEPAAELAPVEMPEPVAEPAPVEMPEPVAMPAPMQMPTPVSVAAPVEIPIPTPTPIPAPTPTPMAPHGAVPKRPRIGKMAAMALLVLALVPASLYFSRQNEPATLPQLNEKLPQAQGTLDRGDPGATQRALATSAAASVPGQAPPAVEALGIADALPGLRDSPSPEPQETTCSQALAALGLCSNEPAPETDSEQIKP